MSLKKLDLPLAMDTSSNNLATDFFIPALSEAKEYLRGVGYFSISWFKSVTDGILNLVENGGKARIITSPIISENEYNVILKANELKRNKIILPYLHLSIEEFKNTIYKDIVSALSWMIYDGVLELKFAIPRYKLIGDFHDKFGIFIDEENNKIAFVGSPNESINGIESNYESIKIFSSWKDKTSRELAEHEHKRFEKLWNNEDQNIQVFEIPDAISKEIIKLRSKERPYKEENILKKFKNSDSSKVFISNNTDIFQPLQPRDYQLDAVKNWMNNGFRGIYSMATGTGKTKTAILSLLKTIKELKEDLLTAITVPTSELLNQWEIEIKSFYSNSVFKCSGNKWQEKLERKIISQNLGNNNKLTIVCTYNIASREDFLKILKMSKKKKLLIADECHKAGSKEFSKSLCDCYDYRIGLSATHIRKWDEEGTEKIEEFFGGVVYEFSLSEAIEKGFLVKYEYFPIKVQLDEDELQEYEKITNNIIKIKNNNKLPDFEKEEKIKKLYIERSKIIYRAKNKITKLKEFLANLKSKLEEDRKSFKHALFYCDPEQMKDVLEILKEFKIVASKFTAKESKEEREYILKSFKNGDIEALVSMKVLDEGVDIPSAKYAFFLASSTNYREFVQRRGRVLRKDDSKDKAYIYDFIVIPPEKSDESSDNIVKRELERVFDFIKSASNSFYAKSEIIDILIKYNLTEYLREDYKER